MSQSALEEMCKACGIQCTRCLDTKKFWKPRKHWTAQLDMRGSYDLVRCPQCSDGHWFSCSHTNILYERGIKVFQYDDPYHVRMEVVEPLYDAFMKQQGREQEKEREKQREREREEKEREEKEREEQEREEKEREKEREEKEKKEKEKEKKDEKKEQEEEILRRMSDGSDEPLYGDNLSDTCCATSKSVRIHLELKKLLQHVSAAIQAYGGGLLSLVDSIEKLHVEIDMSSIKETIKKSRCCQTTTPDGFPVYLLLYISIELASDHCSGWECFGMDCSTFAISVTYSAICAKNIAAKKIMDTAVSNITGVNLSVAMEALMRRK